MTCSCAKVNELLANDSDVDANNSNDRESEVSSDNGINNDNVLVSRKRTIHFQTMC
jgi:hypothetical protein